MLNLKRLIIEDVLLQSEFFLDSVSAGRCLADSDFAVTAGLIVAQQDIISPNREGYTCNRFLALAVYLDYGKIFLDRVINDDISIAVCRMLYDNRFLAQRVSCQRVALVKYISTIVCIRKREFAIRSGRIESNRFAVTKSLKYDALHRFTSIFVDFGYRHIFFHRVGNCEEGRLL